MSDLNKMAEILQQTPLQPETACAAESGQKCACGKKEIEAGEIKWHWTGVCRAVDTICDECLRTVQNHCLVVCIKCKAVVARFAPHKAKDGFVFEARKAYHTDRCPNCDPTAVKTTIIEPALFRNIPL